MTSSRRSPGSPGSVGAALLVLTAINAARCGGSPPTPPPAPSCIPTGGACSSAANCCGTGQCTGGVCKVTPELPSEGLPCQTNGQLVCGLPSGGTNPNTALYCQNGTYLAVFQCPGLEQCGDYQGGDEIYCGTSDRHVAYAKANAPCQSERAAGCSFDNQEVLLCTNGAWAAAIHCPPSNCDLLSNPDGSQYVACANGGYSVGDLCSFPAGNVVCSTDLSKILGCANGRTVVVQSCGGEHCVKVVEGGQTVLTCQ